MTDLVSARRSALRSHPASPLITDCTQGRVELSHATFDNWVAKTVNFLRSEADIEPGAVIAVNLPLHWMTAVWLQAAWESGADVVFGDAPADLRVGTDLDADVLVVPDPLGMAPAPPGSSAEWVFPADVRSQPDQPMMPDCPPGALPGLSAQDLYESASAFAAAHWLEPGGTLQTDLPVCDLDGVLATIAAPLSIDGSVVYGPASVQEAVTASAG